MGIFNDLKPSLEEAGDIEQGKKEASCISRHEVVDVKALRTRLQVSQAEFAAALGTSVDTVKSWEMRRRNPTELAAKVLAAIEVSQSIYWELAAR